MFPYAWFCTDSVHTPFNTMSFIWDIFTYAAIHESDSEKIFFKKTLIKVNRLIYDTKNNYVLGNILTDALLKRIGYEVMKNFGGRYYIFRH